MKKKCMATAGFEPVSLDVSTNEIGQMFRLKYVSLNSNNFFSWQLFQYSKGTNGKISLVRF